MTPNTKAEIQEKRRQRRAKSVERAARWTRRVIQRAEWITEAHVENATEIRAAILGVLKPGEGISAGGVIYPAVYKAFGNPSGGSERRRILRAAIDTVLGRLYLEGIIRCRIALEGPTPDGEPRVVSMIYLRPTNDQPVNIVAARVIGPVWGSLELLR